MSYETCCKYCGEVFSGEDEDEVIAEVEDHEDTCDGDNQTMPNGNVKDEED